MISFDTETELIEPGRLAPDLVCMSWYDLDQSCGGVLPTSECLDMFVRWLEAGEPLLGLNVAYDMGVMCAHEPALLPAVFDHYRKGLVRDLGLDQALIDIARGRFVFEKSRGYSLQRIAKRHGLDLEKEGTPRLTYGRLKGRPLSEYSGAEVKYALLDAQVPAAIHEKHLSYQDEWSRLWGPGQPLLANGPQRAYAAFALHLASCWGVHSDPLATRTLQQELERTIVDAGKLLTEAGLLRKPDKKGKRVKDTKAAKARMEEACKARGVPVALTDKGATSLDQKSCEASGDTVLQAYSTYARADALRARVNDLAQGSRVPLQPRYGPLQDTGRTSSSKPRPPLFGFQIQNMPQLRGARESLCPRPGNIFFGADFSAAEMHTLAQTLHDMLGQSVLADVLNAGMCPHVAFGAALRSMSYEQADKSAERKAIRKLAKPGNFGIPGGMGARTFVTYAAGYGVHLTEDEARHQIQVFKGTYPDIREYLSRIGATIEGGGDTVCYPRSGRWRGGLTYCAMANGYFQAGCADGALAALVEVSRRCYAVPSSALYGCRIWGFVHDEILGEGPIEQAPEAAIELQQVMEQEFNQYVPDVPTTADPAVFWRWSKETDPVYQDGRLVPSDPENAPLAL